MGASFDDILREHGPALWRVIASYAPPGPERDDLAQDVLLAVWQALERFRGRSSIKTFVLRIAHNRGLSQAWARAKQRPGEDVEVAGPRPAPDEVAAAHEQGERLFRRIRLGKSASPREALSFLERRVRVERQGARIFRWAYAAGILLVAIHFRDLFGDEWTVKLVARSILFVIFALTFSAPWWIRRFTDRQEAEIGRWRRWMDEQQL